MAIKKYNVKATLLATVFVGMATSLAGCTKDASEKDFFPEREASAEKKIFDAQAAVGARADATLYSSHFDGKAVNSLGQAKLDLLASNLPDEGPMTVYLDLPTDAPDTKARVDAVKDYLLASHLTEDQFTLVNGINTNVSYPTVTALTDMSKTETSSGDGSSSGSSGSSSSGTATK